MGYKCKTKMFEVKLETMDPTGVPTQTEVLYALLISKFVR